MMEAQERTEDETRFTLRVKPLADELRRMGSDRLMSLPLVYDVTDDLYNVCDVLPQDPTREQFDDFAVRLSNFLEDAHRRHVDLRLTAGDVLRILGSPMSLPIVHRAELRAAQLRDELRCHSPRVDDFADVARSISEAVAFHGVMKRETFCMLYLNVPRWREHVRATQLTELDAIARLHGLRCVELGSIPEEA